MQFRLLVEGRDDKHLIKNLLREHGVNLNEGELADCEGVSKLIEESIPAYLSVASYDAIGIVVDADLDVTARWQSVRGRLAQSGCEAPEQLPPEGLVLKGPRMIVGVWVMPDNAQSGILEDFARQLIPENDPLWPIAQKAVARLPERRFPAVAERKAELHTYLAWQDEPGTPYGLAVTKKYFQTDGELAQRFVDWVRRLRNATN